MKKILVIFLLFFSCQVFAVNWPDDKPRNWYYYELLREEQRLKAHLKKDINSLGSKKTIEAVVETTPTASKVGGSMFKRVMSTAGGKMIGVAAVVELIEAIGWVMEDGTYVKRIPLDPKNPEDIPKAWCYNPGTGHLCFRSPEAAKTYFKSQYPKFPADFIWQQQSPTHWYLVIREKKESTSGGASVSFLYIDNPYYKPDAEKPNDKVVPLTPPLLGAAMLGTGYNDPDPNFDNDSVNTDNWTGVPQAYIPDPSGVGNELADELEGKADRAPKTPDGKAAPIGDPRYSNPLGGNDDANDRQWDGAEGTEGSTDNTEKTDPETGEKTQQGTFKLPKFCDWAMTVCEWYEGWKKTDVKVNQHIDDIKQHQTDAKSFWQSVKDWFNWTKEEPEEQPDQEQPQIDDQGIFSRTFDTAFSLSKQCPPDIPINFESTYLTGSYTFSMNWLCIIFSFMAYPLVFLSHCLGIWILYEAVIQKEIKW